MIICEKSKGKYRLSKSNKSTPVCKLMTQNSLILTELMTNNKINRFDVIPQPIGCMKLPARISEIREALSGYGVFIQDDKVKSSRGNMCSQYYLKTKDIKRLNKVVK